MADLAAEMLRRNARLRAWRAVGVPVEGGWELRSYVETAAGSGMERTVIAAELVLRCSACPARLERHWVDDLSYPLEEAERFTITARAATGPCPHLVPLLRYNDPPEVEAITALELLAGDPPR